EGARQRLEYPPGHIRDESAEWIVGLRVSPAGGRIGFYEGLPFNGYVLSVLDSKDRKSVLPSTLDDFWATVLSPDGDELWFPESRANGGVQTPIVAGDLSGRRRLLSGGPFTADLNDLSADGKALFTLFDQMEWTFGLLPGQTNESRLMTRTDLR